MKFTSSLAMMAAVAAAPTKNIVELATTVPELSTLVTAVVAGKLVDTLESAGPFTVFAPTNEAFGRLGNATLAHLLEPKNIKELDSILTYHVLPEAVQSKDLKPFQDVKTVEGDFMRIQVSSKGSVYINDKCRVVAADNEATNGVVHIIDGVLIPYATKPPTPAPAPPSKNIVALAQSVPDLSTLVTAVVAGKLVDTLSSAGPFTVFAPTNEAFAKVPASTLAFLLDPKNIKDLDAVLTYHVVSGNIQSKDLKPVQLVKTVEGSELKIQVYDRKVYINDKFRVTAADNEATNGVVHIIDGVLIPYKSKFGTAAPAKNIVALAQSVPDLSTLVTAVVAGKLVDTLSSAGPFTVFAPTNEGFAKVPASTLAFLLDPKNIKDLQKVLTYHVVSGNIQSKDLKPFQDVKTVQGEEIRVVVHDGKVYVNQARVTAADNEASNGVVHIIDGVLIPYKTLEATL